jgi:DNA-binding NtrC family response regulator
MLQKQEKVSSIVLLGLADDLALELERLLVAQRHAVYSHPLPPLSRCISLIEQVDASLVFCAAEQEWYKPLLEAIRKERLDVPIIVVSHQTETSEWLDTLQAGAWDYCGPPFQAVQIRWIVESALKSVRAPV